MTNKPVSKKNDVSALNIFFPIIGIPAVLGATTASRSGSVKVGVCFGTVGGLVGMIVAAISDGVSAEYGNALGFCSSSVGIGIAGLVGNSICNRIFKRNKIQQQIEDNAYDEYDDDLTNSNGETHLSYHKYDKKNSSFVTFKKNHEKYKLYEQHFFMSQNVHLFKEKGRPIVKNYHISSKIKTKFYELIEEALQHIESNVPGIKFKKISEEKYAEIAFKIHKTKFQTSIQPGTIKKTIFISVKSDYEKQIYGYFNNIVHEIIHALGGLHEHERDGDDPKNIMLTVFDPWSIMMYGEDNEWVQIKRDPEDELWKLVPENITCDIRATFYGMSVLNKVGLNIVFPPCTRNDENCKYNPELSKETGLYYCRRSFNASYGIIKCKNTICGPTENCESCRVLKHHKMLHPNIHIWQGISGKFYCNNTNCGPYHGENCNNCKQFAKSNSIKGCIHQGKRALDLFAWEKNRKIRCDPYHYVIHYNDGKECILYEFNQDPKDKMYKVLQNYPDSIDRMHKDFRWVLLGYATKSHQDIQQWIDGHDEEYHFLTNNCQSFCHGLVDFLLHESSYTQEME